MKRLGSSDSLDTICPPTADAYGREFESMLERVDEEGGGGCFEEESHHQSEKKRRLSVDQVKALEKNFEVENKVEPERKVKLARELGLQPRQVAVWFQNRRARWKTKQLERDYGVLKSNYDSLKLNFDSLQRDNQSLLKQVNELKSGLQEEKSESDDDVSVKEELQEDSRRTGLKETAVPGSTDAAKDCWFIRNGGDGMGAVNSGSLLVFAAAADLKDGSSDSDSSAILNEEQNNPNNLMSPPPTTNSSSLSCFQFQKHYMQQQAQYVRMEEHDFFSTDEPCNFFSDEQPPTLQQWYCSDDWN